MSEIKAILCDFDGVLGNTGESLYEAWKQALSRFDLHISKEDFFLEEGRSSPEIMHALLVKLKKEPSLASEILSIKDEVYKNNSGFSFYPGTDELFNWAKSNNLKFAVVSGGSKKRLSRAETEPLLSKVDLVITADDVSNRKPSPEPYLAAATKLGVTPDNCVVIENAPLGIESALAAGMRCIAITSTLSQKHLSKATIVVDNMDQVIRELSRWKTK